MVKRILLIKRTGKNCSENAYISFRFYLNDLYMNKFHLFNKKIMFIFISVFKHQHARYTQGRNLLLLALMLTDQACRKFP